jgi:hypothetical protein
MPGVRDLGEVAEHVMVLVGCQRDGRVQPIGDGSKTNEGGVEG